MKVVSRCSRLDVKSTGQKSFRSFCNQIYISPYQITKYQIITNRFKERERAFD